VFRHCPPFACCCRFFSRSCESRPTWALLSFVEHRLGSKSVKGLGPPPPRSKPLRLLVLNYASSRGQPWSPFVAFRLPVILPPSPLRFFFPPFRRDLTFKFPLWCLSPPTTAAPPLVSIHLCIYFLESFDSPRSSPWL